MKTTSPSGDGRRPRAIHWLAAWWQRRRLRIAMQHIAALSPEFRRDLGLDDATLEDLIAHEACGELAAARRAVFGSSAAAPEACAPATGL